MDETNERPKTIPEIRGFGYTPVPRADTDGNFMANDPLYSANSYAALYGITIEEAENVLSSCNTHTQADRMITSTLHAEGRLKEAIGQTQNVTEEDLTKDEIRFLERSGVNLPKLREL